MLRKPAVATTVVTGYLLLYYILSHTGASQDIIILMFIASPFLVIWMAVTILKHGHYRGRELKDNEEWGYGDKDNF